MVGVNNINTIIFFKIFLSFRATSYIGLDCVNLDSIPTIEKFLTGNFWNSYMTEIQTPLSARHFYSC